MYVEIRTYFHFQYVNGQVLTISMLPLQRSIFKAIPNLFWFKLDYFISSLLQAKILIRIDKTALDGVEKFKRSKAMSVLCLQKRT